MKKILTALVYLFCASSVYAHNSDYKDSYKDVRCEKINCRELYQFYIGAYGGYSLVDGAYKRDGQVTQGRLTFGIHSMAYMRLSFGAELGVQSGNTMHLDASPSLVAASGGLVPQSTLKPLVDFLITIKHQITPDYPFFGILKGGVAYRQLQLTDRTSSHDSLQKCDGELQAGFGYKVSRHAMFTAYYQRIQAVNSTEISIDATGDNTFINRIPTQQAVFLGLEYSL